MCGEELLGAVNRCWRCGELVESRPDAEAPPVVAPPIILAAFADSPAETQQLIEPSTAAPVATRTGSPFAKTTPGTWQHWKRTTGREWNASTISAWVAVVVAIYGWVLLSFNPIVAFALSLLALALGIFGLWGRHRRVAILAIILCCPLIAVAGYFMALDIFTMIYGYRPFAEPDHNYSL